MIHCTIHLSYFWTDRHTYFVNQLRSKFETLRKEIKADVRKQHDLYVNNLVGEVKANPRDFYRYINSQKKDTQGIPPQKRKNGNGVAQWDLEKAEEFNGQFTDVFNKMNIHMSRFWIGLHLSWMILLFLRTE